MKTFTDTAGRTWTIAIHVDSIRTVRDLVRDDDGKPVYLPAAVEGKLLTDLSDPLLLCDVLYALCKPQADALKVSDSDFGRAMGGDVLAAAGEAFMEELTDFFPSHRRALFTAARNQIKALEAVATEEGIKRIQSPTLEKNLRAGIANGSSGTVPESVE